ncbi:TetR/AcrR family transcriptional regulator [Rhizorhabdus wittichii]|uniref:TetR/AcrR family transcriptional regulator n=1 Tax=Rhizorhabdus wittichii TaxID=160791 RepID=A0A975D6C9_9SPHN|nr:TetR/AcrR family transcriptional regulator [Rhizorhabdus wittichii]
MATVKTPRQRLDPDTRRAQIVRTALDVLLESGYAAVSIKNVAERCGIRLSTVQHHYPGKPRLMAAVIEEVADRCIRKYGHLAEASGADARERLRATIGALCGVEPDAEIDTLFVELWAYARRDANGAAILRALYDQGRVMLSRLIEELVPGLAPDEVRQRAVTIMAAADGLAAISSAPTAVGAADRRATVSHLMDLAKAPPAAGDDPDGEYRA